VRLVHSLLGPPLDTNVVGALGARVGELASVNVPVSPGFVVGTAAWHLDRVLGDDWGLSAAISEEVAAALAQFDEDILFSVRAARAAANASAGPPLLDVGLHEGNFGALARRTSLGYARRAYRAVAPPPKVRLEQLEAAVKASLQAARAPSAVVVQACTYAQGRPPAGRGVAYTRDPVSGGVWPVGTFRSTRCSMDIDAFSRRQPAVGIELRVALARIESVHDDVRRVSFTLEGGRLWFDDAAPVPLGHHGRQPSLNLEDQQRDLRGQLGGGVGPEVEARELEDTPEAVADRVLMDPEMLRGVADASRVLEEDAHRAE
jgi:hypothetical protein